METNGNGAVQKASAGKNVSPAHSIKDYMEKAKGALAAALPKHLNPDRFLRLFMVAINQNPKLLQCTKESLLSCAMTAAQLGLEPGVLGHVYLIPYNSQRGMQVQFQIGYKGIIELVMRSGQVDKLAAYPVHAADAFEYELGYNERLIHRPSDGDRGPVVRYYAYAVLKSGAKFMQIMSKVDIEKHRNQYSKSANKDDSAWKTAFDEMALKTVLLKLMKFLPKSIELVEQMAESKELRAAIMPEADDFIPTEPVEFVPEEPESAVANAPETPEGSKPAEPAPAAAAKPAEKLPTKAQPAPAAAEGEKMGLF